MLVNLSRRYKEGTCLAIVGSGTEENRNNTYPYSAGLAQPSGITIAEELKIAVFADSESSSIRSINLQTGQVQAICGGSKNPLVCLNVYKLISTISAKRKFFLISRIITIILIIMISQDLHDYGDLDGVNYAVKLQHPLGVAWHPKENIIYITDTYNHKIKIINAITKQCRTIYGGAIPSEDFFVCCL